MSVEIKRVYDQPMESDGYRVLVDRLWPRGLTKERARVDEWAKDVAPTNDLRKWFHENEPKWEEFQRKYRTYLKEHKDIIEPLISRARREHVTLLYASKREEFNNASVLRDYVEEHI